MAAKQRTEKRQAMTRGSSSAGLIVGFERA